MKYPTSRQMRRDEQHAYGGDGEALARLLNYYQLVRHAALNVVKHADGNSVAPGTLGDLRRALKYPDPGGGG